MYNALDTANAYLAVWNAADPAERLRRLEAWHPDARYGDPLMQAEGREALALMIEGALAQLPGLSFRLHGTPDGHGPFVRFSWVLESGDVPPVAAGTDIVRLNGDGRILEVIGFLDKVGS